MIILKYLKDKIIYFKVYFLISMITLLISIVFRINILVSLSYMLYGLVLLIIFYLINFLKVYNTLVKLSTRIKTSKKPEFQLEMIEEEDTFENEYIYEIMNTINNKLNNDYTKLLIEKKEFQDYIDMWLHEMKHPLQNINNKNIEEVNVDVEELNFLIEKVLNLSKITTKEIIVTYGREEIKSVISEAIKSNFEKIHHNKIELIIDIENSNQYIDKGWIIFILNQLLDNSIKYSATKIEIKGINNEDGTYTIKIIDDGVGIEKYEKEYLFDKFYTGVRTKKFKSSSGIGLYMVKKICIKNNIDIDIIYKDKGLEVKLVLK